MNTFSSLVRIFSCFSPFVRATLHAARQAVQLRFNRFNRILFGS